MPRALKRYVTCAVILSLAWVCETRGGVLSERECSIDASGERVCRRDDDVRVDDSECVDEHDRCRDWASMGECDKNPTYMKNHCRVSCGTCDRIIPRADPRRLSMAEWYDATIDFGERQIAEGDLFDATNEVIKQSVRYMRDEVAHNDQLSDKVKRDCTNRHELCAFWVAMGECKANPAYMVTNCAPSCLSCHKIDFNTRCPPRAPDAVPGLRPGELHHMFQRIVDESDAADHTVRVWSRPGAPSNAAAKNGNDDSDAVAPPQEGPWVITLDDFLTNAECDHLIRLGSDVGYERSMDVGDQNFDGSFDAMKSTGRTSLNAWCSAKDGCRDEPTAKLVQERIASLLDIPSRNFEDFQLLRYEPGQFYRAHHDYIGHQRDRWCGPRILTFFLYLSDVEAGGGTAFPNMGNLTIVPKKGRALLWPSVLDEDPSAEDMRTRHEALVVHAGLKYAANAWIHLYNYLTAQKAGCA